jgi:anti-sigma regulatory factor (Ser/Thr protein kinase)
MRFGGLSRREGDRKRDVINGTPTVRLELDSRPECLTLVRGALVGIGESLAFEPELLDDVKTAVSEACANVVLHAYEGVAGPLAVVIAVGHDRVQAAVHDRGIGIRAVSPAEDRMGVGLAVITALAKRAEFISTPGEGTEVRMEFTGRIAEGPLTAQLPESMSIDGHVPRFELGGTVVVSLSSAALLEPVLSRIARGMAAGAHFSIERIRELPALANTLAAHTHVAAGRDPLAFALSAEKRRLELAIGPLRTGSSAGLGPEVGALGAELGVDRAGESETLRLVVSETRS